MGYEMRRERGTRSVFERLRDWFHGPPPESQGRAQDQVLTSTGRLSPRDGETSGEFRARVSQIKSDVLQRALAAVAAEVEREDEPSA